MNLLSITSDSDNNLDLLDETLATVIVQPSSGATASIVNGELRLDYTGVTFNGTDQVTIRICDVVGACTESVISIQVNVVSEVEVFNAVAPKGSSAQNRYMHINGLPANNNKVSIFNRWGDKVYEANNYDNDAVKFEGINDNGTELPSGTYFYKIEYVVETSATTLETKTETGYLSLKQ